MQAKNTPVSKISAPKALHLFKAVSSRIIPQWMAATVSKLYADLKHFFNKTDILKNYCKYNVNYVV